MAMTHSDMINLWPTIGAFAADIGASYEAAKGMRRRGSIPSEYWILVVDAAKARGLEGVSLDMLALAVARPKEAAE